jgi:hypothetical protein
MRFAFTHQKTKDLLCLGDSGPWNFIKYFFYQLGSQHEVKLSACLDSLVYQTLIAIPSLSRFIRTLYEDMVRKVRESQGNDEPIVDLWHTNDVQEAMNVMAKQNEVKANIFIFLDGIDECNDPPRKLINFLRSWLCHAKLRGLRIKLCVSSREVNEFMAELRAEPGFKIHDFTASDIQAYVVPRLEEAASKT